MHRILVLDDDITVHERLKRVLNGGYLVTGAKNWIEANKVLKEGCDLALVDVMLPGLPPGDLVAKTIGEKAGKILLISVIDEAELRQKARDGGCAGYIHKAWDHEKVAFEIQRHLN